jgi:hypothetical protein
VKNDIDLAGWPRWHKPEQVYNACTSWRNKDDKRAHAPRRASNSLFKFIR